MVKNKNFLSSLIEKIKSKKKLQYILVGIIALIIVVLFLFNSTKSTNTLESEDPIVNYVTSLETRLSNVLSKVDGAGNVEVIITVESGMETVLAYTTTSKETTSGTETVTTPVMVNGKTVVLKELYPKITGVLIVAEGANSITVMSKIQQATLSLFDININQIEILARK